MLNAQAVKQSIHNTFLLYPELADDEVLRADVLEGSTNLHEALAVMVRRLRDDETLCGALTDLIKTMQERRARFELRMRSIEGVIFSLMHAADLKKVELAEATLSFRNNPPKVVITDEAALPHYYLRNKPEPDKTKIKEALQLGEEIPGACLSNGSVSLSVRVK